MCVCIRVTYIHMHMLSLLAASILDFSLARSLVQSWGGPRGKVLLSSWGRPRRKSTYCFPKRLRNAYWKTICHYSLKSASRPRSLYASTCLRTRRRDPCNCRRFYSLAAAILVTVDAYAFWASSARSLQRPRSLPLSLSLFSLALPCAAKARADCVDWAGWLTGLLLASFHNKTII